MVARNAFILEEMKDKAKEEGKAEGREEGRAEGREEGIKEGRKEENPELILLDINNIVSESVSKAFGIENVNRCCIITS